MRGHPPKSGPFRQARAGRDSSRQDRRNLAGDRPDVRTPDARTAASIPSPSVARHLLLYGTHAVAAAWMNPQRLCRHLYGLRPALDALAPILGRADEAGLRRPGPIALDRDALDRLLPAGSVHQGLVLDAEPLPDTTLDDLLIAAETGPGVVVLLDQVTDPHNVGAIARSAAAFGAQGIVVQRRHAPEISGVLAKAASGALETLPIIRETNLSRALAELRQGGFTAIGLDERGASTLAEAIDGERIVVVLGAEGTGLRRLVAEGCDVLARLPTQPPISSLNVSNAAAVALYEIARRRAG